MSKMSEHVKHESTPVPPNEETDMLTLIQKIQQHLVFLEKKIDTLISQSSQPRPSFRDRSFSKPRHFGNSHSNGPRHGGHGHGRGHGQGGPNPGFGNRDRGDRDRGDRGNSSFNSFNKDRGDAQPDRNFDRPRGAGDGQGFVRKKKPFFRRDRD